MEHIYIAHAYVHIFTCTFIFTLFITVHICIHVYKPYTTTLENNDCSKSWRYIAHISSPMHHEY